MKKERALLPVGKILLNEGQLDWLPRNPRTWTQTDIDNTAASILEDEDFLEERPILVVPFKKGTYIAFAGNLRHEGAVATRKVKKVPSVIHYPETEEDYETVRRRAIKDNGSFGAWDFDELANNWDDLPLDSWGVPSWPAPENAIQKEMQEKGLSTEGKEGDENYDAFVDKFQQKLTTDDCYTPKPVYDAVLKFVAGIADLDGRKVVRPFFPGGNYEDLSQYPKGCVVVDNPPFSILSKICRFYCERGIQFFLFGPELTLFTATDCDLTYINCAGHIIYENGADVRTGFITNLIPDLRIWVCPELGSMIDEAQPKEDKTRRGFVYPDNIVTAATLGKIAERDVELKIRKTSCEPIKESDSAKEQGRALYGGGFIMSDRAAAERAAAERAAATRLSLSDREKAIIARLNEQDKETGPITPESGRNAAKPGKNKAS